MVVEFFQPRASVVGGHRNVFPRARRWSCNDFAAAFAGVAFAFNGFTLNLLMWPSHIATFSWLPWVILAVEAAWREGGRKIFLAAFVGALQMLAGGPETILLTWLIAAALWLQQFIGAETSRAKMFWRFPLVVALVFALGAAQLLPFLNLVAHAQRESGYTDLRWSMPGSGLANFLVPMAFGTTPILVAAVDAFLDPESNAEQLQAASGDRKSVV